MSSFFVGMAWQAVVVGVLVQVGWITVTPIQQLLTAVGLMVLAIFFKWLDL